LQERDFFGPRIAAEPAVEPTRVIPVFGGLSRLPSRASAIRPFGSQPACRRRFHQVSSTPDAHSQEMP
jgi:hypothetical protein